MHRKYCVKFMIPYQEYLSIDVPSGLSSSITQKSSLVKGVMSGKHLRNLGQFHSPPHSSLQSRFPSSSKGRGGAVLVLSAWLF